MASSGEFIASDLVLEWENPAASGAWNALTTYSNQGKLSQSVGEAETTSYGTTARTYIPGLFDNTLSFTLFHNNTAAYASRPQTLLRAVFLARTQINFRLRPNGTTSGRHEQTFSGFVTKMDDDYSSDDQPVSSDVEVRINGAVTSAAQA